MVCFFCLPVVFTIYKPTVIIFKNVNTKGFLMLLLDYVKKHGAAKTAKDLGVTPPAIAKAVKSKRNIVVFEHDGKVFAEETRRFPTKNTNHD